jgi:hypothetical protein
MNSDSFINIPMIKSDLCHDLSLRGCEKRFVPPEILALLTRAASGTGYSCWINEIAAKQGILTHELPAISKRSNNPADISRKLNARIIPLGWRIEKKVNTKPNESWAWFLLPIDSEVAE